MLRTCGNSIILNSDKIETTNLPIETKGSLDYNNKNLKGVPECPYSICDKCDIDTKYKLYDSAFNNNLINKYKTCKK